MFQVNKQGITFKNKEINMKSAYFPAKTLSASLTNITKTELRTRTGTSIFRTFTPCVHMTITKKMTVSTFYQNTFLAMKNPQGHKTVKKERK